MDVNRAAVRVAEECGAALFVYVGLGRQAWAESRLGHQAAARASFAACRAVERSLGHVGFSDWFDALEAELALRTGWPEEACYLGERVAASTRDLGGRFAEGVAHQIWGQALAALGPADGAGAVVGGEPAWPDGLTAREVEVLRLRQCDLYHILFIDKCYSTMVSLHNCRVREGSV